MEESSSNISDITSTLPDLNINEHASAPGVRLEDDKTEIPEIIPEIIPPKSLKFTTIEIPNGYSGFEAELISVVDYMTVTVAPVFAIDMLKAIKPQFLSMMEEINVEGPNQATIPNPVIGMPCVAFDSEDNRWYRAEILQLASVRNDFRSWVLFVDYGHVDGIEPKNIKAIKEEWLKHPAELLKCKLWGIKETNKSEKIEPIMDSFFNALERPVLVHIKTREPELQVTIIDKEKLELIYHENE